MQQLSHTARQWQQTPYTGVTVAILRKDEQGGTQALLRFETGARLPTHRHPGWESIYLIEGALRINGQTVLPADYVFLPAGEIHEVIASEPCLYMALSQKVGVEIIEDCEHEKDKENVLRRSGRDGPAPSVEE